MRTKLTKSKITSRRKTAKKRSTHNPGLKATMRRGGKRLVHGYETKARASKKKR